VIIAVLQKRLIPQLLGEDPFDIERVWEKMDFVAPTYLMSKAALDIALYDIMGKALNVPMYKLLGGMYKLRFPIVRLIGLGTTEEVVNKAKKFCE